MTAEIELAEKGESMKEVAGNACTRARGQKNKNKLRPPLPLNSCVQYVRGHVGRRC